MFERGWGQEGQGAVMALPIVEGSDVVEERGAGLGVVREVAAVDQFEFEGAPEAFHGGDAVAVAATAHGGNQVGASQVGAEVAGGVSDAPVGTEQEVGRRLPMPERQGQGAQDQRSVEVRPRGPADDLAAVNVQDRGEVKPASPGGDVGDVGDPDLIGGSGLGGLAQAIGGDGVLVGGCQWCGRGSVPADARRGPPRA